jgi:hypothetical protein
MAETRRKNLRDFASALEAFTNEWSAQYSYFRAARELRVLADGRDAEPSTDGYLETVAASRDQPVSTSVLTSDDVSFLQKFLTMMSYHELCNFLSLLSC